MKNVELKMKNVECRIKKHSLPCGEGWGGVKKMKGKRGKLPKFPSNLEGAGGG